MPVLWFNSIEAIATIHDGITERRSAERRRRLLRLIATIDHREA